MKKGLISVVVASAVLGAASLAFAGAYHEAEQPEEIPAPAPAPPPVVEPEPERALHKFDGFLTDAETTHGLWAEIGSVYGIRYHPAGDSEGVNTYAHISYGKDMFEVGVIAPYIWVQQQNIGPNNDENDFGDLRVWGKVMPLRTEMFTLGGGLIVSFPTGDHGMGTAEYGFEPFITGGVDVGPAAIRGSVGYNVFTEHDVIGDKYDRFDSNLGVLFPIGDMVVLRAEVVHQHLMVTEDDPISIIPGVDFYIPAGSVEVVLRPTAAAGLNDQAPDWQAGLGIAVSVPGI